MWAFFRSDRLIQIFSKNKIFEMSTLLKNCGQVVVSSDGKPKIGKALSAVETLENVDVLIRDGKFAEIGSDLSTPD